MTRPTSTYDVKAFYTRMSNIGFRLLLVRGDDGLTSLGHTPAISTPARRPARRPTARASLTSSPPNPIRCSATVRAGDHARTRVACLRIGPVGTMWLPAEILPESTIGLPAGLRRRAGPGTELDLALHAFGAEY